MQQHGSKYFTSTPPAPNPGVGGGGGVKRSKFNFDFIFFNKLKGMEHRAAPCKHIFSPFTHREPVGWIEM